MWGRWPRRGRRGAHFAEVPPRGAGDFARGGKVTKTPPGDGSGWALEAPIFAYPTPSPPLGYLPLTGGVGPRTPVYGGALLLWVQHSRREKSALWQRFPRACGPRRPKISASALPHLRLVFAANTAGAGFCFVSWLPKTRRARRGAQTEIFRSPGPQARRGTGPATQISSHRLWRRSKGKTPVNRGPGGGWHGGRHSLPIASTPWRLFGDFLADQKVTRPQDGTRSPLRPRWGHLPCKGGGLKVREAETV